MMSKNKKIKHFILLIIIVFVSIFVFKKVNKNEYIKYLDNKINLETLESKKQAEIIIENEISADELIIARSYLSRSDKLYSDLIAAGVSKKTANKLNSYLPQDLGYEGIQFYFYKNNSLVAKYKTLKIFLKKDFIYSSIDDQFLLMFEQDAIAENGQQVQEGALVVTSIK